MESIFSKVAGLVLSAVVLWLLNGHYKRKKISSARFLSGLTCVFIFTAVVLIFDRIGSISGAGLSIELAESIDRKADKVERLSIRVAELAAFNARVALGSSTVDWTGPTVDDLLSAKSNAIEALKESGASKDAIQSIEKQFDEIIARRRNRKD